MRKRWRRPWPPWLAKYEPYWSDALDRLRKLAESEEEPPA
jgi:hypothetical protein